MRTQSAGQSSLRARLRWLVPGLGVKRWLGLLLAGAAVAGLGMAYLLADWLTASPGPLDLRSFSHLGLALLMGGAGLLLMLVAVAQIQRTLLAPFLQPGQDLAGAVSEHRRRGRGPRIVAIGGGTGLSTLLRGLKTHSSNLTAIVTVADDGGSSGRLRRSLGVLPPGDFRNCIAALADDEAFITQLFQYRFGGDHDLGGHSFGNLFITAMADVTGSFERALVEASRVLAIRGQVLPSTLQDVTLVGELEVTGEAVNRVEGESRIPLADGAIRRVYLQPDSVPAYPAAIRAVLDAELIVLGPGSLYTSLLPNLLVGDLAQAIASSRALKVYVCNTATQPGETGGYSVLDHVQAIERHTGRPSERPSGPHTQPGLFPMVLANTRQQGQLLPGLDWVKLDPPVNGLRRQVGADLIDEEHPWRHDSGKLAGALMTLLSQAEAQAAMPGTLRQ